ncbi:MAG: endonuclease/exonuclease/phosphatase family protein [Flavobacterium sp.]
MKKLSVFNKFVFFLNVVVSTLTFLGYVLPFLAPKFFPILSVLTLFLPLFLILNGFFFIYWLLMFKRQMLLSALVLLLGITFINKFYKFSKTEMPVQEKDFTVMTYNVRLFNLFDWIKDRDVPADIKKFIDQQNPDILCLQEFSEKATVDLKVYKYSHIVMHGHKIKTGQAIFSKFPILNSGSVLLPNSNNNVIFADLKKGLDTIRIYSIHLESIRISPDIDEINNDINGINQQKSEMILRRISKAFKSQQTQAELIMAHKRESPYPIIVCGDMNNSAYSYVYRSIRGNLNDSFEENGSGFGQTYNFKYYPARIDYIFVDPKMKVKNFETFPEIKNSDHYPIMSRLHM